jgi:hypothetical protein
MKLNQKELKERNKLGEVNQKIMGNKKKMKKT